MRKGVEYKRNFKYTVMGFFIEKIGKTHGIKELENALIATKEHIKYYYQFKKNKSEELIEICKEIIKKNNIKDISFDDLFEDEEKGKK